MLFPFRPLKADDIPKSCCRNEGEDSMMAGHLRRKVMIWEKTLAVPVIKLAHDG